MILQEPLGKVEKTPLTLLLVEDNKAHAELVIRSFEGHRLANRIIHVSDGEAALDYLNRRGRYSNPEDSPRPHVVLLDLKLPKISGLEVLEEVRRSETLKQLPVVVLSTSNAQRDISRAYEAHANGYVVKPLDYEVFEQLMDEIGLYWLGWNQAPKLNGS